MFEEVDATTVPKDSPLRQKPEKKKLTPLVDDPLPEESHDVVLRAVSLLLRDRLRRAFLSEASDDAEDEDSAIIATAVSRWVSDLPRRRRTALAPAPFAPPLVVASSQSLRRGRSRLPRLRWSNAARHHRKDTRTGGRGARRSPTAITLATGATRPARARLRRSSKLAPARAHVRLETRSASPRLRHRDVRVGVSGVRAPRGSAPADRSGLDELDPELRTLLRMALALCAPLGSWLRGAHRSCPRSATAPTWASPCAPIRAAITSSSSRRTARARCSTRRRQISGSSRARPFPSDATLGR